IGRPDCTVPTLGMDWLPTVPPVVPDLWQWAAPAPDASFTTIANWQAYGSVTYEGERYGQKDEEFMRFISLPRATSQKLELALSGASASVVEHLRASGWAVRDASRPVGTDLEAYRLYISHSRGEFSVAKNAYVKTCSGWFSDRSVCYLASGLPVVLQETGFSDWLPTGMGVLPFSTLEEAADCIRRVNADYAAHQRAARELAEEVFSHEVVLPRLLEAALNTPNWAVKAAQPEGTL
ncbi:MAG TPA: glycosyltransferase family 1 protein, partial [Chloroflexia bacterium]|nr:glycosyltransferase family 1 protein [Chloroflexia bacterium]